MPSRPSNYSFIHMHVHVHVQAFQLEPSLACQVCTFLSCIMGPDVCLVCVCVCVHMYVCMHGVCVYTCMCACMVCVCVCVCMRVCRGVGLTLSKYLLFSTTCSLKERSGDDIPEVLRSSVEFLEDHGESSHGFMKLPLVYVCESSL